MSNQSNENLASQAESQAILEILNFQEKLGQTFPITVFDKMVDKKAEEIFEDLMNQPGPCG